MSRVMPPVWRSRWKRSDSAEVAEHAERDAPDRTLRDAHEDHVAQLLEERGREAQQAVDHEQRHRHRDDLQAQVEAVHDLFMMSGTPTLATLAVTRQASARTTRPLYSQR